MARTFLVLLLTPILSRPPSLDHAACGLWLGSHFFVQMGNNLFLATFEKFAKMYYCFLVITVFAGIDMKMGLITEFVEFLCDLYN